MNKANSAKCADRGVSPVRACVQAPRKNLTHAQKYDFGNWDSSDSRSPERNVATPGRIPLKCAATEDRNARSRAKPVRTTSRIRQNGPLSRQATPFNNLCGS